jgi:WD40-like Beta Propeller Repeat
MKTNFYFLATFLFLIITTSAASAQTISGGQIVYSRAPGGSVDNNTATVWAINADGSGDHQITFGDQPRISPDGTYIIFRRKYVSGGSPNYQGSLWIRNLTTNAETLIYANNSDYITGYDFAPAGQKIFVDYGCVIQKMDYDGANRQTLDSNCYDDAPTPRKTDGLLTFHGFNGEIFTSNADGSNRQVVPNTYGNNYSPAWSNDGQFILYAHYDGSGAYPYYNDSLYKIKPDGTGKITLKTLSGGDRFSAAGVVSADNSKIYMPAIIGGVSGIYTVLTDGSGTISFAPVSNDLIASGTNVDFVGGISPAAPTAADVSVGGRVLSGKRGISNVRLTLTDSTGETRYATTNSFGFYRFGEVAAGQTYVLTVNSKRYSFSQPTRIINVSEDAADENFIANE